MKNYCECDCNYIQCILQYFQSHLLSKFLSTLSRRNQQIQLNDSNCKLYLQPTAPTFDFHCGGNDEHPNAMPHIATISNNAIFYRAPSSNAEGCSAWELERYASSLIFALPRLYPQTVSSSSDLFVAFHHTRKSNHVQYQGVRLVNSTGRPSFDSNNGTTVDAVVVGCVVQDVHMDSHYFTIQNTSPSNIQGRRSLAKECFLRSPVNDFRFAKDGTLNGKPIFDRFVHSGSWSYIIHRTHPTPNQLHLLTAVKTVVRALRIFPRTPSLQVHIEEDCIRNPYAFNFNRRTTMFCLVIGMGVFPC